MSSMDCIEAIQKGGGGGLSDEEILEIAETIQRRRARLVAEGKLDGFDARLAAAAREEGDKVRLAAALQRKHAALNAIVRDRLETAILNHVGSGLSYPRAVQAILDGSQRGVQGARASVAATRLAYEGRFLGDMVATIERERPQVLHLLREQAFTDDVVKEMFELREGGQPGRTGNADAAATAKIFATFAELSRTDMNRLGGTIGKLDGWAGPQVHDPYKLLKVTEDQWVQAILPHLDQERTFGRDGAELAGLRDAHAETSARRDVVEKGLREGAQQLDAIDNRVTALNERHAALESRRAVAEAELKTLQDEHGVTIDRYTTNVEREHAGRILLQVEGRDTAAERHSMRRKEAARENNMAISRLRDKGERAHALLDRIEGLKAENRLKVERLAAQKEGLGRQLEQGRAEREALGRRLVELETSGEGLRDTVNDPAEFLREAYRSIVTGRDNTVTAAQKGEHVGPANLARSLAKHRVLHFKSQESWLAYNRAYGHGNIVTGMVEHQRRAARLSAQMDVLGPNPEMMMRSLLDSLQQRVRNDPTIPAAKKNKVIRALSLDTGWLIPTAFGEVRGMTLAPADVSMAKIGSSIRAIQSMAKLGGAVISSTMDMATNVAALTFQGKPILRAWSDHLVETLRGSRTSERREIAYLLREGYEGLIGHMISPDVGGDNAPGAIARAMETFFRWNGVTAWTDGQRAAGARQMSAHMGSLAQHSWEQLPPKFRHVLGLHGLTEAHWEAIRQGEFRLSEGRTYITPDRMRSLSNDAVDRLVPAADIAHARAAFKVDEATMKTFDREIPVPADLKAERQAKFDAWLDGRRDKARRDLEMGLRRYFADEVNYGTLETDEASRRLTMMGTRPGTPLGEAIRLVMQFKSFPVAFAQRVMGRAVYGGAGATPAERLFNNLPHIGHLLASHLALGYMVMTTKDALRGWWPPRDPADLKTWMAAFVQGGGAGIYGDFLFAQASRFGNGPLETLAGPTLGSAASLVNLYYAARDGDHAAGKALSLALQNTPYVNLFYARPALDYLVLNSLHEAASPGYLRRQERQRQKEFHQSRQW